MTLTHRDVFNKIRCASTKTRTTSCTIVRANNNPLTVRLAVETNLKLDGIVVNHEVLACDDLAQDLLIGTDILKPNKFLINFATGTLEVNAKSNHLVFKTSKEVCRVIVFESITVPPRSVMNIVGKVDGGSVVNDTTGVLEPETRFEERYSTGILKVVATVKRGSIPVRVFNAQDKLRRIYRGSTIGQLCPLIGDSEEETSSSYRIVQTNVQTESTSNRCMTAQPKDRKEVEKEWQHFLTSKILQFLKVKRNVYTKYWLNTVARSQEGPMTWDI